MSSSPIKSSFVSSQVNGLTQIFFHTFFYNTIFYDTFPRICTARECVLSYFHCKSQHAKNRWVTMLKKGKMMYNSNIFKDFSDFLKLWIEFAGLLPGMLRWVLVKFMLQGSVVSKAFSLNGGLVLLTTLVAVLYQHLLYSKIFSISSLVKISITWSFPANNIVFSKWQCL